METFMIFFPDGKTDFVKGNNVAIAMIDAGYSDKDFGVMSFYEVGDYTDKWTYNPDGKCGEKWEMTELHENFYCL